MRSVFLLLTVSCVWLAFTVNRASRRRIAVDAIRNSGGHVFYKYEFTDRTKGGGKRQPVQVSTPATTAWLSRWLDIHYFEAPCTVQLESSNDEMVACVNAFPHLQELYLTGRELTDAALSHIRGHRQLERLYIAGTSIEDDGLRHLAVYYTAVTRLYCLQYNDAEQAIDQASIKGARIICFPECFVPFYRGIGTKKRKCRVWSADHDVSISLVSLPGCRGG